MSEISVPQVAFVDDGPLPPRPLPDPGWPTLAAPLPEAERGRKAFTVPGVGVFTLRRPTLPDWARIGARRVAACGADTPRDDFGWSIAHALAIIEVCATGLPDGFSWDTPWDDPLEQVSVFLAAFGAWLVAVRPRETAPARPQPDFAAESDSIAAGLRHAFAIDGVGDFILRRPTPRDWARISSVRTGLCGPLLGTEDFEWDAAQVVALIDVCAEQKPFQFRWDTPWDDPQVQVYQVLTEVSTWLEFFRSRTAGGAAPAAAAGAA